jgi:hypothetical protein
MKVFIFAGALALLASPALAVPYCDPPMQEGNGMTDYGFGPESESDAAAQYEQMLHSEGVGAHQTRFWNGCIQTWVTVGGREEMRIYDRDSLRQLLP